MTESTKSTKEVDEGHEAEDWKPLQARDYSLKNCFVTFVTFATFVTFVDFVRFQFSASHPWSIA